MRDALVLLIIVLIAAKGGETRTTGNFTLSLKYSCHNKPFLSVSAYAAGHASFPDVDLRLVDPSGRSSGKGSEGKRIPNSHYGKVIEMPSHPASSKAVAVEVCDAIEGDYIVVVSEHSKGEYGFAVSADNGGTGNEAMGTTFHGLRDRTCKYEFRFLMKGRPVTLRWLGNDHVQTADPVCELPQP